MTPQRTFTWHRQDWGKHGIRWQLWEDKRLLGACYYLSGSRRYCASAGAPVRDGVVLCDYWAGTSGAARKALERDWDKRSIGLFGVDVIAFKVAPCS